MSKNPGATNSASHADAVAAMLFDQFSRYESCAEVIRSAVDGATPTVLDVGSGHGCLLGGRLPEATVTYLDPLHEEDGGGNVIAGTIDRLRTDERRWDWVVAIDTLEHVPPSERSSFVDTVIGRARTGIVLSGPYREDAAAREVDDAVNATYRQKTGRDYPWLEEHSAFGLPSSKDVCQQLEANGFQISVFGNGHAPWLKALLPLCVCYLDEAEHLPLFEELSATFNEQMYRFDHLEPVYRRVVVAHRDGVSPAPERLPDTSEVRAEAARAWEEFWRGVVGRLSSHADESTRRLRELAMEGELDRRLLEFQSWAEAANERADQIERDTAAKIASKAKEVGSLRADLLQARNAAGTAAEELENVRRSLSWRLTAGVRWLGRLGSRRSAHM